LDLSKQDATASIFAATAAKLAGGPKYGESGLIALFMSASPVNTIPNRWRIRNNLYQAY